MNLDKILIIIPSYKPPENFPELIRDLQHRGFKNILVIDDGSPASFEHIFSEIKKMQAEVIRSETNMGKGHALQLAFQHMSPGPYDFALTCDDDGQHHPDDVLRLAHSALRGKDRFYIGARNFSKNIPLKSLIGNLFMRYLFLLMTWKKVSDTQTGLRCFHTSLLPHFIECSHSGFNFETVTLSNIIFLKEKVIEIPIETIYFDGNKSTRFKGFSDSLRVVFSMLVYSLKRRFSL